MTRFIGILLIFLSILMTPAYAADADRTKLLVLAPKLNAAYDRVFSEITTGIVAHKSVTAHSYTLTNATQQTDIQKEIEDKKIDAVIALGQTSYNIAEKFRDQLPVIHGGMIMNPNNGHSGISLVGSPAEFLSHLRNIAPGVKRVFTVYNEINSGWLIKMAEAEARKYHIELHALQATDIRHAAQQFKKILDQIKDGSDAVWLLFDKVVPDQTILPVALDAAWKKNIVLFSNNPAHAKRGALFSLFPDNEKMGYNLAELSIKQMSSNAPLVLPLSSLKVSVNERTASHLGLHYSGEQRESFDIIYPLR